MNIQNESKKTLKIFGWASFLNDFGSDIIFPLWPMFLTSVLGASRFPPAVVRPPRFSAALPTRRIATSEVEPPGIEPMTVREPLGLQLQRDLGLREVDEMAGGQHSCSFKLNR